MAYAQRLAKAFLNIICSSIENINFDFEKSCKNFTFGLSNHILTLSLWYSVLVQILLLHRCRLATTITTIQTVPTNTDAMSNTLIFISF